MSVPYSATIDTASCRKLTLKEYSSAGSTYESNYLLMKVTITDDDIKNATGLTKDKIIRINKISPVHSLGGSGFQFCMHSLVDTIDDIWVTLLVRNNGNSSDIPTLFTFTFTMLNNQT